MGLAPEGAAAVSIDDDFAFVTEQLERLRELAARDETHDVYDDEDVYDLSIRWGTALAGRLPRMAHYRSCGLLEAADERRFESLCAELREVTPLIESLRLARPDLADGRQHRKGQGTKRVRLLRR